MFGFGENKRVCVSDEKDVSSFSMPSAIFERFRGILTGEGYTKQRAEPNFRFAIQSKYDLDQITKAMKVFKELDVSHVKISVGAEMPMKISNVSENGDLKDDEVVFYLAPFVTKDGS